MSCLYVVKCEFNISTACHVCIFLFFAKLAILKVVHPLKKSAYKISWS